MKKVLFYVCPLAIFFAFLISCQIGLGKEVDLEAPIITLTKMQSGSTEVDSSHFGGGVYCKKTVSFFGKATDNVKVESVNAEIKWNNEVDFQPLSSTTLSGDSFQFDFTFETTGIAYIKFVATDEAGNYNVKSSRVVTLLVDDEAPVGKSWYINRKLNGIQYALKPLEELKTIDLELPENKDAAQNVAFSIHSAFNDEMGIKPGSVTIKIKDESGNLVCEVPNSSSNDYSPVFEITHDILVGGGSQYAKGKHYLQVWYDAEDVVTLPESNKAQDIEVDGGWFIWWPESDLPKISQKPALDEVTNSILLNVNEAVTVTVFDDDALAETICALLTEIEYGQIKDSYTDDYSKLISVVPEAEQYNRTKQVTSNSSKRDEVISFIAPKSPQVMHLVSCSKDVGGKTSTSELVVNVTDATSPILYIASPSNNSVPSVEMKESNSKAIVTIQGQVIDTAGCTNLDFIWVPNVVATDNVKKSQLARSYLTGTSSLQNGLKLWSVKLGKEENASNGYKKQVFSFEVDLLNDFICGNKNEKNENKFFVAKVTRKDGKYTLQEYKLSADTTKPIIKPISPENTTQIIGSNQNFELQFYAEKANGLAIDTSKYTITGKLDGEIIKEKDLPTGKMEGNYFTTTISADTLKGYETSGKRPIYTFTAEDIFGNVNSTSYTIIVSSLPQLNSITSTSPDTCIRGESIIINANFSDTINDNGSFATNPPKLILQGFSDNKEREAKYVSGVGSPTLVFEYTTVEGDSSASISIKQVTSATIGDVVKVGYIDVNGNTALEDGTDVHLNTSPTVLEGKTIKVDAVSPKVEMYEVTTSVEKNTNGKYYLNQGKIITATVTLSKNVFVQGAPTFKFTNGIELDFVGSSSNLITFSGAVPAGVNGALEYKTSECITNYETITDTTGNTLLLSNGSTVQTDIIIDTTAPKVPSVKAADDTELTNNGEYPSSVKFKIKPNDTDVIRYEYSLDAGISWKDAINDGTDSVSQSYAELTARVTDKAGNVSSYPTPIKLNIESSFPAFNVDCLTPNGNYKKGDEIKFRIYFEKEVNLLNKGDAKIIVGNDKYATVKTAPANKLKQIDFSYIIETGDNFNISVDTTSVSLGEAVVDLFGFMQGNFEPTSVPSSINIHCDGIAPTIVSAIPNDGTTESPSYIVDGNNIYTTGNQIKITFSEPVQKGSGNLILRQTAGWAIPPVLTAEEFNTICAQLTDGEKNILALRNSDGTLMEDVEDNQLFVAYRNNKYHGTGQYVGPYKKSMQGLKDDGSPNVSAKFVLDFDLDIWDDDSSKNFGKTFNTYAVDESFIGKTEDYINNNLLNDKNKIWSAYPNKVDLVTPKEPEKNISVKNIRAVLEKAGLHQRVLDVTSPNVKVDDKVVTITFPKGLIDQTDALPDGREWELVFEQGTFLDITGNEFGEGLTKDAIQENRTQTEVSNTWQRGRTSITDGSKPLVLIKTNGNEFFNSDKVATPVVRVDRYSYGLGIRQSDEDGTLTAPIANDGVKPTGYVRVRIDCETKDAFVYYDTTKETRDEDSIATNKQIFGDTELTNSYITNTSVSIPETFSTPIAKGEFFAAGSGFYNKSCKEIIATIAKRSNFFDSGIGKEGVFQTVVKFVNPTTGGNSEANQGANKTDWSIRGTTSKGNEPYISPYPLRDTPNGSPYLRLTYRNGVNYYWVSYEVLVDSSFSGHGWARARRYWYNWAKNWGLMEPGELTKCEGMKNWE